MDIKAFQQEVNASGAYPMSIGAEVTVLSEGYSEVILPITKEMLNVSGQLHGGISYALADFATGAASKTFGKKTVTLDSHFHYFRAADLSCGQIKAVAKAQRTGRTIAVYTCDILAPDGKVLCTGTFTYFVMAEDMHVVKQ